MGLLDGEIASLFGEVFGNIYLPAQLVRIDNGDDGEGGGTPVSSAPQNVSAQVDACTEAMRLQDGYTTRDVRLIVLQSGVTGGPINADCIVTMLGGPTTGTRFLVKAVSQDPAASYWECRATPE